MTDCVLVRVELMEDISFKKSPQVLVHEAASNFRPV